MLIFCCLCIDRHFSTYIWEIKIALKVLNILISNIVQMKLNEELLCIPFMAAIGLVEGIVTLSAVSIRMFPFVKLSYL